MHKLVLLVNSEHIKCLVFLTCFESVCINYHVSWMSFDFLLCVDFISAGRVRIQINLSVQIHINFKQCLQLFNFNMFLKHKS